MWKLGQKTNKGFQFKRELNCLCLQMTENMFLYIENPKESEKEMNKTNKRMF